jgi:hypothetical protein
MELAGRLLGLDTGLRSRLAAAAMSTSDFPNILANVVSKRLRSAYEVAPQNWKKLSRQNNAPDFKARAITQLSNLPNLKLIVEGGEYTHAALPIRRSSTRWHLWPQGHDHAAGADQ